MLRTIGKTFCLILSITLVFLLSGCSSSHNSHDEGATPPDLTTEVSTFAGTAETSGSSDGTGVEASFYQPYGITTDGTNLYITDRSNRTIRQIVIATAEVTTLAGTAGVYGVADGIGSDAEFREPTGITTDGTYLYVTDKGADSIRMIDIDSREVTTLAGGTTSGSSDGTGIAAQFNEPYGIDTDGTNLYVADSANHTVRKIEIATAEVTTLAGTATIPGTDDGIGTDARFNQPRGIFCDGPNVYVADSKNHTIRKIIISTGEVTTYAGTAGIPGSEDGIGTAASFFRPIAITSDGTNFYVADYGEIWDPVESVYIGHYLIRKIVIATGEVTTIAGQVGPAGSDDNEIGTLATFYQPSGLATDGTSLFVVDRKNHTIREIQ